MKLSLTAFAAVALLFIFAACSGETPTEPAVESEAPPSPSTIIVETPTPIEVKPITTPAPGEETKWTDDELQAMALTLAGECYDDKAHDKRLVCEVILNRVSDGRFGDSICEVLTAENQFAGYWRQSRPVTDNDIEIASQTLDDWFKNNCEALSEYLFFCAGDNRENSFR